MTRYLPMHNTFEFLSVWRLLDSPDSKPLEFDGIKNVAERYSGACANRNLTFQIGSRPCPNFKRHLNNEFQRPKDESHAASPEWRLPRTLTRVNYRTHADAIKADRIPPLLTRARTCSVFNAK